MSPNGAGDAFSYMESTIFPGTRGGDAARWDCVLPFGSRPRGNVQPTALGPLPSILRAAGTRLRVPWRIVRSHAGSAFVAACMRAPAQECGLASVHVEPTRGVDLSPTTCLQRLNRKGTAEGHLPLEWIKLALAADAGAARLKSAVTHPRAAVAVGWTSGCRGDAVLAISRTRYWPWVGVEHTARGNYTMPFSSLA